MRKVESSTKIPWSGRNSLVERVEVSTPRSSPFLSVVEQEDRW